MRIQFTFAHVEAFIAVAESGSFRAASERLHISQPAVTSRIQQLERRVGLALMTRTTRSVSLTPEGQRFLDDARQVLAGLEDLAGALRERVDFHRGVVSIAALPSIAAGLLPRIMGGFRARHPHVTMRIIDTTGRRAADLVANGEVDLAITSARPRHGMEFTPLWADPCVALTSPDHPLARHAGIALADIADHPLLLYPPGTTLRETIDRAFARQGLSPRMEHEAYHVATLVSLAEAGFGIAFVPEAMLRRIAIGSCALLDFRDASLDRRIGVLRMKRPISPAVAAFIAFCRSFEDSRPRGATNKRN